MVLAPAAPQQQRMRSTGTAVSRTQNNSTLLRYSVPAADKPRMRSLDAGNSAIPCSYMTTRSTDSGGQCSLQVAFVVYPFLTAHALDIQGTFSSGSLAWSSFSRSSLSVAPALLLLVRVHVSSISILSLANQSYQTNCEARINSPSDSSLTFPSTAH
ncbi:hypothetical protein F66182_4746 [Fusarium sp. NRRL 66182]|nr:hypothetical protein F66182_4746 [Fusarium sp. NRRL 66182]